ncbi:MAG: dienelactone hydrolase, partial [Burkholderiaceae bacterium]
MNALPTFASIPAPPLRPSRLLRRIRRAALSLLFAVFGSHAAAAVGLSQIAATEPDGPITLLYPSGSEARVVQRGPFTFQLAEDGEPVRGNGRLVVVSHGTGGSPWVHAELARTLVEAGFVVALPEHRGDNYR